MPDSRKVTFPGSAGHALAARIDLPSRPRAFALLYQSAEDLTRRCRVLFFDLV
jgi:hypothetical protein